MIIGAWDQFRLIEGWGELPEYFLHCLPKNQVVLPEYYLIFARKIVRYMKNSKGGGGLQPPQPPAPHLVRLHMYVWWSPMNATPSYYFLWQILQD